MVVSCDMRSGSEGGGEDERVEFSIPSFDLLRLLFFENWGVLSKESENTEFCLNIQTRHGKVAVE